MLVVLLDSRNFRNHVKFKPISEHHGVGSAIHIKAGEYLKPETYMLKPIKQPKGDAITNKYKAGNSLIIFIYRH